MKHFPLSLGVAILLHAVFLWADFSRLELFSTVSPQLETVTMTLIAYSPPDLKESPPLPDQGPPVEKSPEVIETPDTQLPVQVPEVAPDEPIENATIEDQSPLLPETEIEPDQLPPLLPEAPPEVEAVEPTPAKPPPIPPEPVAVKNDTEKPTTDQVWQKPKRSLKARTKVLAKKTAVSRPPPSSQIPKPAKTAAARPQEKLPASAESAAPKPPSESAVESQNTTGLASALEAAANAVASVNKQVPAPKISLAKPLYRHNPPPKYPKRAQRRNLEGLVLLDVWVNDSGKVKELTIFKSSGHKILDRAALKSVKNWLFQPGTRDGQKIEMRVRVPVRFQLN